MRCVALDTSTKSISIALSEGSVILAEQMLATSAHHAQTLLPVLQELLVSAEWSAPSVDVFGVGVGPGSFTGTRIGVATAKGLALSFDKPLYGVGSLQTIAQNASSHGLVGVATDAQRGKVYAAAYRLRGKDASLVLPPCELDPEQAREELREADVLCGDGLRRYPEIAQGQPIAASIHNTPRAAWIALHAQALAESGAESELDSLEPHYVRPTDAKLPKS